MRLDFFSPEEEMFLHSLDSRLPEGDLVKLELTLQQNSTLKSKAQQYLQLREMLMQKETDSFGPFFAERILHQIKQRTQEIDYLILFFFKKYQLVIIGIVIALLAANIFTAEELTLKSILGMGEQTIEDIISIDVYKNITE
ncbi:MAG: hypothetical protein JNM57_03025 [Cyclobacteriaceae bacterium]|nr:hypothetical protein [Cyclobacteriaceae bacterium]